KLHLDFFKAGAAAAFALALAGIKAERARVKAGLAGGFGLGEQFANVVKRAGINGGIGTGSFAQNGLIHEDDATKGLPIGYMWCVACSVGVGRCGIFFQRGIVVRLGVFRL